MGMATQCWGSLWTFKSSPSHLSATLPSACFRCPSCLAAYMSGCKLISHCPWAWCCICHVKAAGAFRVPPSRSFTPPWYCAVTSWCPVCVPACSGMHRWDQSLFTAGLSLVGIGFLLKESWRNNCYYMVVLWAVLLPSGANVAASHFLPRVPWIWAHSPSGLISSQIYSQICTSSWYLFQWKREYFFLAPWLSWVSVQIHDFALQKNNLPGDSLICTANFSIWYCFAFRLGLWGISCFFVKAEKKLPHFTWNESSNASLLHKKLVPASS